VRNTVAHALSALCDTIGTALQSALQGNRLRPAKDNIPIVAVSAALQQARDFISGGMSSPLDTKEERCLLTDTLQALEHASRLADLASDATSMETVSAVPREVGAAQFCVEAMKNASMIADEISAPPASHGHDAPHTPEFAIPDSPNATPAVPAEIAIAELERCTQALDELQRTYRSTTLKAAANRELAAGEAMARVDGVRRLAALAGYAFRSAAHLVGRTAKDNLPDAIPF
jgi:phosphate:Na+ symporter